MALRGNLIANVAVVLLLGFLLIAVLRMPQLNHSTLVEQQQATELAIDDILAKYQTMRVLVDQQIGGVEARALRLERLQREVQTSLRDIAARVTGLERAVAASPGADGEDVDVVERRKDRIEFSSYTTAAKVKTDLSDVLSPEKAKVARSKITGVMIQERTLESFLNAIVDSGLLSSDEVEISQDELQRIHARSQFICQLSTDENASLISRKAMESMETLDFVDVPTGDVEATLAVQAEFQAERGLGVSHVVALTDLGVDRVFYFAYADHPELKEYWERLNNIRDFTIRQVCSTRGSLSANSYEEQEAR